MSENPLFSQLSRFELIRRIAQQKRSKIFLVGGALRDHVLGRPCTDFDFATDKNAIAIAHAFAKKIKGAFVLLDEEHRCARVARKENGMLLTFDFADFRASGLKGDLSRRDFTVNAVAADLFKIDGKRAVEDLFQDPKNGLKDLAAGRVRMVSPRAFKDDPLRLVRAFSLQALLDFTIEPKTLSQIKKDKKLLSNVSAERVRDELFKILSSPWAYANLKIMDKIGLLEEIIPQVTIMYHLPQGGYHHLPLWLHSLETVRQLEIVFQEFKDHPQLCAYLAEPLAHGRSRQSLLKLAAILHDIGKPDTHKKEKGKTTFHGHEQVGRHMVRPIAKTLKLSVRERMALENMVAYHLRPGYLSNFKTPSERAIFRYFRDTKEEAMSVLLLSLADQRSTRGPLTTAYDLKHHEDIVRDLVRRHYEKRDDAPKARLLTGHDLIRKLKLTPSPLFKKILIAIEEKQALGEIATKAEALEVARKMSK